MRVIRQTCLLLHRYIGLGLAVFLIVVGITGSLLAFLPELNRLTAPALYPREKDTPALGAGELAERVQSTLVHSRVTGVNFYQAGTVEVWTTPLTEAATGKPHIEAFDQVFVDPYTGNELGRRFYGQLSQGWVNLMPFIYQLHYSLALGAVGAWVLGIAAFLWTVDCVVSTYLTLPARQRDLLVRTIGKTWWQRWRPAWLVRWTARGYRLNFDLHRAGGLWLWIALLVFAWSSVYMNFHDQVYAPLTRMVFEYPSQPWESPVLQQAVDQPLLGWRQAGEVAERLMSIEASAHGFVVERPIALSIDHQRALYHYTVHSNLDFQDKRGRTSLSFNANTGEPNHLFLPTGQYSGLTVTNWLATLHEANVFGLPYRIFVVVLGLAIAMLSITGVYIWLKKRRARLLSRQRRSSYG